MKAFQVLRQNETKQEHSMIQTFLEASERRRESTLNSIQESASKEQQALQNGQQTLLKSIQKSASNEQKALWALAESECEYEQVSFVN